MPFNVNNCTITSLSSIQNGTDSVTGGQLDSSYTLTISPDAGFAIDAVDFSVSNACYDPTDGFWYAQVALTGCVGVLNPNINYVEFTNNGADVDVEIVLNPAFAMGNANQIIDICIDGNATTLLAPPTNNRMFSVEAPINQNVTTVSNVNNFTRTSANGEVNTYDSFTIESNERHDTQYESFNTPPVNVTYSAGDIVRIVTRSFTVNSGYFSLAPTASLKSRNPERYIISSNSKSDNIGRVTSRTFTIDYIVPEDNTLPINTGDKVIFNYDSITKLKPNE